MQLFSFVSIGEYRLYLHFVLGVELYNFLPLKLFIHFSYMRRDYDLHKPKIIIFFLA